MVALFLRTELPCGPLPGRPPGAARTGPPIRARRHRPRPRRRRREPGAAAAATRHRGYGTRTELFDGFPYDVRWQWMAIAAAELARVRYIDYDYWVELSGGSRLAVDAAPRIRAGVAPFGVPSDGHWAWRRRSPTGPGSRR